MIYFWFALYLHASAGLLIIQHVLLEAGTSYTECLKQGFLSWIGIALFILFWPVVLLYRRFDR